MSAPERRLNGVSSVSALDPKAQLPYLDPTKWRVWMEDWTIYDTAQTDTPIWTLTNTNTGGVDTVVTPGKIVLTLDGGADDACKLQADHAKFFLVSGKKAMFETKIKIVKASGGAIGQEGFVVGLTSIQTSTNFMDDPPPTTRAFDDGWGFMSYDATANMIAFQGEADVFSTEVGCTTYADDTWMTLAIYYDGSKSIFYKDGSILCEISTNEPTSVIAPVLFISAGEAKADVIQCAYMFVATER